MVLGSAGTVLDTMDVVVCRMCFETYDASQACWTNVTVNDVNRSDGL